MLELGAEIDLVGGAAVGGGPAPVEHGGRDELVVDARLVQRQRGGELAAARAGIGVGLGCGRA